MKRSPFTRLLLLAVAMLPLTLCAQKTIDNNLLWRISGNGLTKPSWLYGTIHLIDKQVFNFGDSVYAALEACEGYAMEIVPDSMVATLFREEEDSTTLKETVTPKIFDKLKKKLQERFDKKPEEVTVKEFKAYFTNSVNKPGANNAMHTIMDAWFFDAVRRQGKWVGGLEDVEDQRAVGSSNFSMSFYIQDFLNDHRSSKQMLDKMIKIYNAEDLEGIEMIEQTSRGFASDSIMLRRNRKMARRMDSLAHLRSTFFAVGSAHLPGDSGVINYLRRKGFTVQPVRSSKRVAAGNYQFTVKQLPWKTVTSANGAFSIQLPGEPQDSKKLTGNLDMKVYVDIGANMAYMALCVDGTDDLDVVDSMMATMARNISKKARIIETRAIEKDSVKGREMIAKGPDAVYRMRSYAKADMIYFTMVSSPIDSLVRSTDATRFFSSLVIHKKSSAGYSPWSVYTSDRHLFSVRFPGKPTVKLNEEQEANAITEVYSSFDIKNNIFAQCMVQDMDKGFYLTADTGTFANYKQFLDSNEAFRIINSRLDTVLQYPAMWVELMSKNGKSSFYNKVLNLHRGNRIYYLLITTGDSAKNKQFIDNYFSSFRLLPYKEDGWKQQTAPDNSFSLWSPGTLKYYTDTSADEDKRTMFELYDSIAPITWNITKTPYSANYWTDSDTALLRRTVMNAVDYNDTLLNFTWITNSGYQGAEATIGLSDNHNVKKTRLWIAGDTLVEIFGYGPPEVMALASSRRMLEEFSINYKATPTIFTSKATALLKDLQSEDSATFAEAKRLLSVVHFTKADLPLLHKAMLEVYADDSLSYMNASANLFRIVGNLKDETTLGVIKQAWTQLPPGKEGLRYGMLSVLGNHTTAPAYQLAKDLLLQHPPQAGNAWTFFGTLRDSLQLTATIMPELLPLLKDTVAGPSMISLVEALADSSQLDIKVVLKHKELLYNLAGTTLKKIKQDEENAWMYDYHSMIRLLTKLKEPAANQWARKFLLQSNLDVKYTAALGLLKAGLPVEAAELLKLAADKGQRAYLYDNLKEMKKLALFPKQYLTQQAIAESELYTYASDENDVKKMTFIGERTVEYKGVRKKFYLYKVDMSYEDEKIIHLGIAGPYSIKPAAIITEAGAIGIDWEKEYNAATIDADLKAYLKEMEEYEEQ